MRCQYNAVGTGFSISGTVGMKALKDFINIKKEENPGNKFRLLPIFPTMVGTVLYELGDCLDIVESITIIEKE